MQINDLNYLTLIDSKTHVVGGNSPESYWSNWSNWLQSWPEVDGNFASASFSAIAVGDNTYTNVEATLVVTETSSSSSVRSVAISTSS